MKVASIASRHRGLEFTRPGEIPASGRRLWRLAPAVFLPVSDTATLIVVLTVAGVAGLVDLAPMAALGYGLGVLAVLAAQRLHRLRLCLRVSDQVPRIAAAAVLPFLVLLPWIPSRSLALAGVTAGAVVTVRSGLFTALRVARGHGYLLESALIIGTDATAGELAKIICGHRELGLRLAGLADRAGSPHSVIGAPEDVATLVAAHRITRVVVSSPAMSDGELTSLIRQCRSLPVDVCLVPRLPELGMGVPRACLDELWGIPLVPLRRRGHTWAGVVAKRAFDILLGAVLLLLTAVLQTVFAVAVRVGGGGPAFFRQERVSKAGALISVLKIRTIRGAGDLSWTPPAKRCTPLGRWLRATHFDELPQLVNVLRGEMSLVGPRPERPFYAVRFAKEIPRYDDRHRMPGGMTGWAQIHGLHGDTSIPERARFDNHYIEYWSPWLDVVIVTRTFAIVLGEVARTLLAGPQGRWREHEGGQR